MFISLSSHQIDEKKLKTQGPKQIHNCDLRKRLVVVCGNTFLSSHLGSINTKLCGLYHSSVCSSWYMVTEREL